MAVVCLTVMGQNSDSITVSLITCYPGSDVYELYGHTEIRVQKGWEDNLYNYGMFNFNAPHFVYRFAKGETDYMVADFDFSYLLRGYEHRKIVQQVLDLTPGQAQRVSEYLHHNVSLVGWTYRYNYLYDNCATRPRDIIERAVGTSLRYGVMKDTLTFRQAMAQYNRNYPWQQFGIDIALGSGIDKTMSYRDAMFAPVKLMEAFAGATIERDGKRIPLVKRTEVLNPGSDAGDILPPTPWWTTPLALALLLLASTIAVTVRDLRRGQVNRWFDSVLFAAFTVAGCIVVFLVTVSTHEATSPNMNGFWLHPFYIIPAVLIWIKSAKTPLYYYHFINFAVLMALLVAWYWLPQAGNAAFFPLIACAALRSANYITIYRRCEIKGKKTD